LEPGTSRFPPQRLRGEPRQERHREAGAARARVTKAQGTGRARPKPQTVAGWLWSSIVPSPVFSIAFATAFQHSTLVGGFWKTLSTANPATECRYQKFSQKRYKQHK